MSRKSTARKMPALLMRMSMRPKLAIVAAVDVETATAA